MSQAEHQVFVICCSGGIIAENILHHEISSNNPEVYRQDAHVSPLAEYLDK